MWVSFASKALQDRWQGYHYHISLLHHKELQENYSYLPHSSPYIFALRIFGQPICPFPLSIRQSFATRILAYQFNEEESN